MVPATLAKLDLIRSGIVEHDLLFSGIVTVDPLVRTMNVREWSRYLILRQNERRRYRERESQHIRTGSLVMTTKGGRSRRMSEPVMQYNDATIRMIGGEGKQTNTGS